MSLEANKQIAQSFIAALPTGAFPDEILSESFTAWTTTSGEMPGDRYRDAISKLSNIFASPLEPVIERVSGEGDCVVAELRSKGPLINGDTYANRYVFIFTFAGDKIARVEEHFDPRVVSEKLAPLFKANAERAKSDPSRNGGVTAGALADAPRPAHVPSELVVDFDIFNPPGGHEDVLEAWRTLQGGPALVWTPHNGGHWIGTRGEDLVEMQTNYGDFSHRSITIPPSSTPSLPLEIDPPRHTGLRAVISPLFAPQTLMSVEPLARELAISLIEGFKDRGECEFQSAFARHLPIVMFLKLVDLPIEGRQHLLELADKRTRSPIPEERNNAKLGLLAYMQNAIEERRREPRDDFISRIIHSKVDGEPLSDSDINNLLATTLSGGLDTVASMMGFVMMRLASHPELQERVVREPAVIPKAVDEMIRRHGLANTARVITHDMTYKGIGLREGEMIVIPTSLIGLDPTIFEHPEEVDFDRPNASRHGSFGNGVHRCPGMNLGRMEIRIMLQEWTTRIPHWEVDHSKPLVTKSGSVNTVHEMHLRWPVDA